ncbi:MAG: hypothetical protein Q9178_001855 [Gyalolechia marmorata]
MLEVMSVGKQQMDPQPPSNLPHIQRTVSRQSSDIEYEIAHQLIQHAQGRGDINDFSATTTTTSDKPTEDGILQGHPHTDKALNNDRMSESQYAPLKNPPALGQVCSSFKFRLGTWVGAEYARPATERIACNGQGNHSTWEVDLRNSKSCVYRIVSGRWAL